MCSVKKFIEGLNETSVINKHCFLCCVGDSSSIVRNQQNKESYTSYRDLQKVNRDEYDQKVAASQRAAMRDQGSPSAAPTRPYKQTPSRSTSVL